MSEAPDKESKTEEPTDHRLKTAIEKGNIPLSREVIYFSPLAGILAVLFVLSAGPALHLVKSMADILANAGEIHLSEASDARNLMQLAIVRAAAVLAPAVLVIAAFGLLGSLIQNTPRLVPDRIMPKASRLSLIAGWQRIFGAQGLVEFAKAAAKLVVIGVVLIYFLSTSKEELISSLLMDPAGIPGIIFSSSTRLVLLVVALSLSLVAADIAWSRYKWRRDLRMTRQEVKDEHKQMDGDPIVKARMKSLARDRARRRMIAAVPRATVVIANPTHFAVALRYVRSEGGAPLVLAKGKDLVALRIREVAEQHGIAVVEDKPLARSLYESVEVDRMIPPEFYKAVANIILFLKARGKLRTS